MMVFMGVSQHAEFDFDVRFARGDAHMLHPENTPEFNLKVALSPPGVLLVIYLHIQVKRLRALATEGNKSASSGI